MTRAFLTHGSNAALIALVLAFCGGVAAGRIVASPQWVLLGAALFFCSEYGWHRFAFHAAPSRLAGIRRLQHRLHYDHHAEPERLDLLFLPIWFVAPNLLVTGALAWLATGSAAAAAALVAGAAVGLLWYEWVHYVAHVPYRPRTRFGRWIRKYHLRHHFKNERRWFGVSNPVFDLLWRTGGRVEDVARSPTTHDIAGAHGVPRRRSGLDQAR